MEKLKLKDVECPICFGTLFEPVTLPCKHDFCLKCFEGNVRDASLRCPICRQRFGSWLRRKKSPKQLVNQEKWKKIRTSFPERIQCIIDGVDEPLDSYIESPTKVPISSPGAIKKEFQNQLDLHRIESEKELIQENEASMALIKKLMDENEISAVCVESNEVIDNTHSIPDIEGNETCSSTGLNGTQSSVSSTPKSNKRKAKRPLPFNVTTKRKTKSEGKIHQTSITSAFERPSRVGKKAKLSASSDDPCRSCSPEYMPCSSPSVSSIEIKTVLGLADDEYDELLKEQKRAEAIIDQQKRDFAIASELESQLNSSLKTRKKHTIENYYKKINTGK